MSARGTKRVPVAYGAAAAFVAIGATALVVGLSGQTGPDGPPPRRRTGARELAQGEPA